MDAPTSLPVFRDLPEAELRWLLGHGQTLELAKGEFLMCEGDPRPRFYITLDGELQITRTIGGQQVVRGTTPPGIMAGEISLLYNTPSQVSVRAIQPSVVLVFDQAAFRQLFATCPTMAARIFQTAADRARGFAINVKQQEKMAALGKLSAGLAHELNNPAAAARRAAHTLADLLPDLQAQTLQLGRYQVADRLIDDLTSRLHEDDHHRPDGRLLSPLERADAEDEIGAWLDERRIEDAWDKAATFVESGFSLRELQERVQDIPAAQLGPLLAWLNCAHQAAHLLEEIEQAVTRISTLIETVKAYTFMDQAPIQSVDIHRGIDDTLRVLQQDLAGVTVVRDYDPTLPIVEARGSELNQVWTSLIGNAVDAMAGSGTLRLATRNENDYVMVEVADSGAGIPDDVLPRIFEPFFTTKGVGAGVGLGLDMVYRIVTQHGGSIDVQSRPGHTRFIVRLPVAFAGGSDA
jgi:signal transduction histidine kinase